MSNTPIYDKHECEGACARGTCYGEIVHARVFYIDEEEDYDWGMFWYCKNAIAIEQSQGMMVEIYKL